MANKLAEDICRIVGHQYKEESGLWSFICLRCGQEFFGEDFNKRIAKAMSQPLKQNLDYEGIGRKLLKVEELPQNDFPIYDKDLPAEEA